jgi:hypothetical protein
MTLLTVHQLNLEEEGGGGALAVDLVAYYPCDEASGDLIDAHDDNDMTDLNTVGATTGKVAGCRDVENGNSEGFSIADNADLSFGDIDFTIAAWLQLEEKLSGNITWCGKANGALYLYYHQGNDRLAAQVFSTSGFGGQGDVAANNLGAPSTGTWYFVVFWHDATANTINIQVNNGTANSVSHTTGVYEGDAAFYIGRNEFGSYWDGLIDEVGIWKRVLTADERTDLYNGGSGRDYDYIAGGGLTNYDLDVDSGSYAITGTAATLKYGHLVSASSGTYAMTGTAATLLHAHTLTASAGSYTVSGTAATLSKAVPLSASAGSYTVTGTAATLLNTHIISAASGSYTETGTAATLTAGKLLTAAAGSYVISGTAATLNYSGSLNNYELDVDAGSHTVTGTASTLLWKRILTATPPSFDVTGTSAGLTATTISRTPLTPVSPVGRTDRTPQYTTDRDGRTAYTPASTTRTAQYTTTRTNRKAYTPAQITRTRNLT